MLMVMTVISRAVRSATRNHNDVICFPHTVNFCSVPTDRLNCRLSHC